MALKLVPERDLRLRRGADFAHQRLNFGSRLCEERLEALRVGPFVDDHDLAVLGAVEPMGDDPMRLRAVAYRPYCVRVCSRTPLELLRIAVHAQSHDHRHTEPPRLGLGTIRSETPAHGQG